MVAIIVTKKLILNFIKIASVNFIE